MGTVALQEVSRSPAGLSSYDISTVFKAQYYDGGNFSWESQERLSSADSKVNESIQFPVRPSQLSLFTFTVALFLCLP